MSDSNFDPFLTFSVDHDGGPISFYDVEDIKTWVSKEREAYEWLESMYKGQHGSAAQAWLLISRLLDLLDRFIRDFNNHGGTKVRDELVASLKKEVTRENYISSESADAAFVFQLLSRYGGEVAAYALSFLLRQDISFTTLAGLHGAFLAMQYEKGSPETVNAQLEALEKLKQGWAYRFGKQNSENKRINGNLTAEIAEHKDVFASIKDELNAFYGSEKEKFQNLYTKKEQELLDIKQTYEEKMALLAPVEYWTKKRSRHSSVMFWMGGATVFIGGSTMTVFMIRAGELVNETVAQAPLGKISILLAVSTAGIWLTRLCTKIFVSNLHLRTDADERVTMIQTYLALLREGNGPKEGDRELILPALFRPTSTGFIKEDGPAGFFEILKLVKRE